MLSNLNLGTEKFSQVDTQLESYAMYIFFVHLAVPTKIIQMNIIALHSSPPDELSPEISCPPLAPPSNISYRSTYAGLNMV